MLSFLGSKQPFEAPKRDDNVESKKFWVEESEPQRVQETKFMTEIEDMKNAK